MLLAGWITLGVVAAVLVLLMFSRISPDFLLLGGVVVLMLCGVLTPSQALSGFSNEGMLTVAFLFVVAAGIRETGAFWSIMQFVLGAPRTVMAAQFRFMFPVAFLSGFMNNTPLVAMMLPVVSDWAKKIRLPASKLLIPLSYAAILGGICTLIGTSTNLVVNGLTINAGFEPIGMFEITRAGVPCAIVGLLFIIFSSKWLLPDRSGSNEVKSDPREYTLEMVVQPGGPLAGKTVEEAGLRHLPGLYLIEISKKDELVTVVSPQEKLEGGDQLVFAGVLDSVVDLQKIRGLQPATHHIFKLDAPRTSRIMVEAVISHSCPLVGKSIREGKFRTIYNAVVIAVSRNGERIKKKLGDIVLRAGDTLLVEALPSFVDQQRDSRDFYLVSRIHGFTPPRHEKAWVSLAIMGAMVAIASFNPFGWEMLQASMIAAALMLVTRCCGGDAARRSLDYGVLLAIAASFGLGKAIEVSGAASYIASSFLGFAGENPYLTLATVYVGTVIVTELVTNNAAAVLMFPIGVAAAARLGVDPRPFIMAIMIGASSGFATPIGYQTNLMVYGPGGYRASDFMRIGLPLDIVVGIVAIILIPLIWHF